jgi:hypothetical protein
MPPGVLGKILNVPPASGFEIDPGVAKISCGIGVDAFP